MSSYAAKVALICALALVLISACGQLRTSLFDDPSTVSWSESDDSKELHKSQHLYVVEMAFCPSLEPTPDFAALAETTALGIDALFGDAVLKRGPPAIDS